MATLALPTVPVASHRTFAFTLQLFVKEIKYEFLKLFRTRSFSLAVIGFPVMFYIFLGLANRGEQGGVDFSKYLLAGYACSGMISAALYGVGVGMASERAAGWLELKRASPMPPLAYLIAKCVTAQVFGVIVVAVLLLLNLAVGHAHLSPAEAALLLLMPFAGAVPFAAMGLLIALIVPPNAASGIVNLIYMPMAVMSGLWIPLSMLPHWLRTIAPVLPAYHLSQIPLHIFGYQDSSSYSAHWVGLIGFMLLMLGGSWAAFHRAEQNG